MAQALQDVRGNDAAKRADALRRLERAPNDQKKRKDFEDARADAAKRKEVNAALVEILKGNDRANKQWAPRWQKSAPEAILPGSAVAARRRGRGDGARFSSAWRGRVWAVPRTPPQVIRLR